MGIEIDGAKCCRCGRIARSGSRSECHVPHSPLSTAVEQAETRLGAELTSEQVAALAVFFEDHAEPWPVECNNRAACDRRVRERAADLMPGADDHGRA